MQRVCSKCGTLVTGDGDFCPSCGSSLPSVVDLNKNGASQSAQYGAPGQNSYQGGTPNYGTPTSTTYANSGSTQYSQPIPNQEMTLGQWVATVICCTWFGIISLILCIVWGFSDSTPTAKKNYCRAMLILQVIGIVLYIIFLIVFISILSANEDLMSEIMYGL